MSAEPKTSRAHLLAIWSKVEEEMPPQGCSSTEVESAFRRFVQKVYDGTLVDGELEVYARKSYKRALAKDQKRWVKHIAKCYWHRQARKSDGDKWRAAERVVDFLSGFLVDNGAPTVAARLATGATLGRLAATLRLAPGTIRQRHSREQKELRKKPDDLMSRLPSAWRHFIRRERMSALDEQKAHELLEELVGGEV